MIPADTIRPESPEDNMTKRFTEALFRAPVPVMAEGHRLSPVPTVLIPVKTERTPEGVTVRYDGDVPMGAVYRQG